MNYEERRIYDRARYWANPEKARKRVNEYRKTHFEARSKYNKEYRMANLQTLMEQRKEHYHKNRDKFIALDRACKANRRNVWVEHFHSLGYDRCSRCGYDKCFNAIDFHHIKPSEKILKIADAIARVFNEKNIHRVREEIKKCLILCSNCHREIHFEMHKKVLENRGKFKTPPPKLLQVEK